MINKIFLSIIICIFTCTTFAQKSETSMNSKAETSIQDPNQLNSNKKQDILNDVLQIQDVLEELVPQMEEIQQHIHAYSPKSDQQNNFMSNERIKLNQSIDINSKKLTEISIKSDEGRVYLKQVQELLTLLKELGDFSYSDKKYNAIKKEYSEKIKQHKNYQQYLKTKLGLVDSDK